MPENEIPRRTRTAAFKEWLSKTNAKAFMRSLSVFFLVLCITVASVMQLALKPENISWTDWIGNTGVMVAITIVGIFLGESWGTDHQKNLRDGKYQLSLHNFRGKVGEISTRSLRSPFQKWYIDFMHRRQREHRISYLQQFGVIDAEIVVDEIDRFRDFDFVEKVRRRPVQTEGGKYVATKNEEQLRAIQDILDGEVSIKAPSSAYYMSELPWGSTLDILDVPAMLQKKRRQAELVGRGVRIFVSVLLSAFWAMITVQEFMDAGNTQAWMNLVTRITLVVTAIFNGYLNGVVYVSLDTAAFENKVAVLDEFVGDVNAGRFAIIDQQEEAKKEFEKWETEHPVQKVEVVEKAEAGLIPVLSQEVQHG